MRVPENRFPSVGETKVDEAHRGNESDDATRPLSNRRPFFEAPGSQNEIPSGRESLLSGSFCCRGVSFVSVCAASRGSHGKVESRERRKWELPRAV